MKTTFADFARGFWDKPTRTCRPRPTALKSTVTADSEKCRRLIEQMANIIQELMKLPTVFDTDQRLLTISRAVAFLLSGGR